MIEPTEEEMTRIFAIDALVQLFAHAIVDRFSFTPNEHASFVQAAKEVGLVYTNIQPLAIITAIRTNRIFGFEALVLFERQSLLCSFSLLDDVDLKIIFEKHTFYNFSIDSLWATSCNIFLDGALRKTYVIISDPGMCHVIEYLKLHITDICAIIIKYKYNPSILNALIDACAGLNVVLQFNKPSTISLDTMHRITTSTENISLKIHCVIET